MQWLVKRQLRENTKRLKSARADLVNLDFELSSFSHDADDLRVRALTSDRVDANLDYQDSQTHANRLTKARADLIKRIADLSNKQNELLDKLGSALSGTSPDKALSDIEFPNDELSENR
jgi:uncharacterized coiled-coil DUF342 family protein